MASDSQRHSNARTGPPAQGLPTPAWMQQLERATGKPASAVLQQAGGASAARARRGTILVLLDCSGSMAEGRKFEFAKNGVLGFAEDARRKGYESGLIRFADSAQVLAEPSPDLTLLRSAVASAETNGSTNLAAAIRVATDLLRRPTLAKWLCVVTDGMPNSVEEALLAADDAKAAGIRIITIGTDDADIEFLRKLATDASLASMTSNLQLESGIRSMSKVLPALPSSVPNQM